MVAQYNVATPLHEAKVPQITAVNGNKRRVIAGITLPVTYEHKLVFIEFQVIDENCISDVILGCNGLRQLGFELHDAAGGRKYIFPAAAPTIGLGIVATAVATRETRIPTVAKSSR